MLARQRRLESRGSFASGKLGRTLFLLGTVYRERGDWERALALHQEYAALHSALQDREGLAIGLLVYPALVFLSQRFSRPRPLRPAAQR